MSVAGAVLWARTKWASASLIRYGIADDHAMRRYLGQVRFAQLNPLSPKTAYGQQP
jgi:hypothetical protein